MARQRSAFTTVHTEGAMLPADALARIADRSASGMSPADYHLQPHERINESISQSWNRLVPAWAGLKTALDKLPAGAPGTTETRERWLLVIFDELGFGRLSVAHGELDAGAGRKYAISHVGPEGLPIHLVGFGQDLDRRTPGRVGAATSSPHGLLQEFLNDSPTHRWGVVNNGRQLRLLRDNTSLTRQAFVEFDLEDMFEGEVYSDFALLWLVCHESRFAGAVGDTWLDRWSDEAQKAGVRALDTLRDGVQAAIEALGSGFVRHQANSVLRAALRSGALDAQEYYRQLLRLVYRLIFLFVSEDRDLLLRTDTDALSRGIYLEYYSIDRLRRLASRWRGATAHPDLWRSLSLVMSALGTDEGLPALGLPSLGSFLWSRDAAPALEACDIANRDLLTAVRQLAFVESNKVKRQVDYRNLGPEELGGIYESLLELHPRINLDLGSFELRTAGGHERKTSGSYYTPTSLITSLLDSAVEPVIDEAARKVDAEKAILDLRVVDPACGSGHFLIAAAHRIARRLAATRTGLVEPAPPDVRAALRDVIGHCLYGVDMNPMAVELCKVSLWIEALDPGRPLSFLDHRIRCGNSLLGGTPDLIAAGIPDEAFNALDGDNKAWVSSLRRRNRGEREGQLLLGLEHTEVEPSRLSEELHRLDSISDDSPVAIHEKEKRWVALQATPQAVAARLEADAWCTAFMAIKRSGEPVITDGVRQQFALDPAAVVPEIAAEVGAVVESYSFFHWHLEFADVWARGGFDIVLGNPPWDRVKLQEKEWLASRRPDIANAASAKRKALIKALAEEDPSLYAAWLSARRQAEGESHFLHHSGRYPLCGRGDVNTYAVFAELMRSITGPSGRAGMIVPSGIATDDTTKYFFRDVIDRHSLVSLYEFENEGFFIGVGQGHMNRFCLLTLNGSGRQAAQADLLFQATTISELADPMRHFQLTADEFALLNPNTRTSPIFRSKRDAELTKEVYRNVPILVNEDAPDGNPWNVSFMAMLHMSNDAKMFRSREQMEEEGWALEGNTFARSNRRYLALYESKMINQYDHRRGDYGLVPPGGASHVLPTAPDELMANPSYVVRPRYWVPAAEVDARLAGRWNRGWLLGWRNVTDARASARTLVATVMPRVGTSNSLLLMFSDHSDFNVLVANLDSFVLDYVCRQKLGGLNLTYNYLTQLPVLTPSAFNQASQWDQACAVKDWIRPRVLELIYTAWDLASFAKDLGCDGPPFRWDRDRRSLLRSELDAAFFHLYGIGRNDVDYILETFPIVRRSDEAHYGDYATKRLILERYDAMAAAITTGVPYDTIVDPPPADPRLSVALTRV